MLKDYLNKSENTKVNAIKDFLEGIDLKYYSNRFETFDEKTEIITWEEIEKWVDILAEKIKDKGYCGLYGVPRGGIIIAVLLSYKTKLPLLLAPCKNCLVVDDDLATGVTVLPYLGRYDIAVMYKNPHCSLKPTYYYQEYGETFKVFVWNKEFKKQ